MKRLIAVVLLVLPVALFAQSPKEVAANQLKRIGLSDAQAAQVLDIESKTRSAVRQDLAQLRLLHAQMDKALLPSNPNLQEVNGYIAQMAQTHADLMKTAVGARVQLRQIMGDDIYDVYSRFSGRRYGIGAGGMMDGRGMGTGGMMDGDAGPVGGMMGGAPMMGGSTMMGGSSMMGGLSGDWQ